MFLEIVIILRAEAVAGSFATGESARGLLLRLILTATTVVVEVAHYSPVYEKQK